MIHGPSKRFDDEVELASLIGGPIEQFDRLPTIQEAHDRFFGMVMLCDLSARDIQGFEYKPLGPVNGKNCGNVISPYVVSAMALENFQVDRVPQDPPPNEQYLGGQSTIADISIDALLTTEAGNVAELGTVHHSSKFRHIACFRSQ